jgi:drug/metabolite transporter (DMT)-like permease
MPVQPQTSKAYFTQLALIYTPLLIIQIVFGAVSYYLVSTGQFPTDPGMTDTLKLVALLVIAFGVLASSFLSKAQFKAIKQKASLPDKMKAYRPALLTKWALLETPGMFCIVCFLITGSSIILGLAGPSLIMLIIYRPTVSGACMDLELNPAEKALLENPSGVIAEVGQSL